MRGRGGYGGGGKGENGSYLFPFFHLLHHKKKKGGARYARLMKRGKVRSVGRRLYFSGVYAAMKVKEKRVVAEMRSSEGHETLIFLSLSFIAWEIPGKKKKGKGRNDRGGKKGGGPLLLS